MKIFCVLIERLHTRLSNAYYALILVGREFHKEIVYRVDSQAVVAHLVVQVGCQREARIARQSNHIATLHLLPAAYQDAHQVAVCCLLAIAVVDYDGLAQGGALVGNLLHLAVGCGENR